MRHKRKIKNNFNVMLFILIIGLCCISTPKCYAQYSLIVTKSSDRIPAKITATSNASIFTSQGTFTYGEIDSIYFQRKEQKYQEVYDRLGANKIIIAFLDDKLNTQIIIKEQEPINRPDPKKLKTVTTEQVVLSLDKYRIQSQTGKGLQLLGLIISTASIAAQYSYNKKFDKDYDAYLKNRSGTIPEQKNVSAAIPIVAIGISIIGFGIDMDANRHLKIAY